jgi:transcriptional regulator GlxA family with amidase domain
MKAKYELTPNEYLQEFRLERAKRLLVTTEWPIERIAEEVGFRYSPYFSACFMRSVGLSPIRFRKQFLK